MRGRGLPSLCPSLRNPGRLRVALSTVATKEAGLIPDRATDASWLIDRMRREAEARWGKNVPAMIPSLAIVSRAPAMFSLWSSRTGRLFNTARVAAGRAGLVPRDRIFSSGHRRVAPHGAIVSRTGLVGWWRGLTGTKKLPPWGELSRNLSTNSCGTRLGGDEREYFIRIALSSEMLLSRVRMLAFAAASVVIACGSERSRTQ